MVKEIANNFTKSVKLASDGQKNFKIEQDTFDLEINL